MVEYLTSFSDQQSGCIDFYIALLLNGMGFASPTFILFSGLLLNYVSKQYRYVYYIWIRCLMQIIQLIKICTDQTN